MTALQFKGYQFSIAASVLAAVAIGLFFFGVPGWAPAEERHMTSSFAVMYVLLTYLFLQMVAHIFYGPASKSQMIVDMLSSILPVGVLVSVFAEYMRSDLPLSTFQLNAALVTIYAMVLDLLVDIGLTLWPKRSADRLGPL